MPETSTCTAFNNQESVKETLLVRYLPPGLVTRGHGFILCLLVIVCMLGVPTGGHAQTTESGMTVSLALNPTFISSGDTTPLKATITVTNVSGGQVLTRQGFSGEPWEVLLIFTSPSGDTVTSHLTLGDPNAEDEPPTVVWVRDAEGVNRKVYVQGIEVLSSDFTRTVALPDARQLYELMAEQYTVQVIIPFQRYEVILTTVDGVPVAPSTDAVFEGYLVSNVVDLTILGDADADGYTVPVGDPGGPAPIKPDCQDADPAVNPGATEIEGNGIDDDCDATTLDVPPLTPALVTIEAELFEVGGGNQPGVTKSPLVGLPVQLFDQTSSCVQTFGTSFQAWASIWGSSCPAPRNGVTDEAGLLVMSTPPGDYLAIGQYQPVGFEEPVYVGKLVGTVAEGQVVSKTLRLILRPDGPAAPGQSTILTGSELRLIHPLYIGWDSPQESYPFIFESVGAWSIKTTIDVPTGFVSDSTTSQIEVDSSLTGALFTVTSGEGEWVNTSVTQQVTHNRTRETVTSKIGVRLSKELAHQLGISRWGQPDDEKGKAKAKGKGK